MHARECAPIAASWDIAQAALRLSAAKKVRIYIGGNTEFDFGITEWEDVLGLATFGIVGSLAALVIDEFLSFPD